MTKVTLLSVFFILLLSLPVFAGELNYDYQPEIIFSKEWENTENTSGRAFFLFSKCSFLEEHGGSVILFRSEASISGIITGNVYSFFSDIEIMNEAAIGGQIYTFSSVIRNIFGWADNIAPLFFLESLIYSPEYVNTTLVYDGRFPAFAIIIVLCLLRQIICVMMYGFKPSFFHQGSVLLNEDPLDIIQMGLITYFLALALALVFLFSVVGAAISILILLIAYIFVLLGQTALEISLGSIVSERLDMNLGPYACFLLGGIAIEMITFIPFFGLTANLVFLPILCFGVLVGSLTNGFLRRRFYVTPFDLLQNENPPIDRTRVNMILKGGQGK